MSPKGKSNPKKRDFKAEFNVDDLIVPLQRSNLEDTDYLLFNTKDNMEEIPRYLFRVFTPYSQGKTDSHWVKSRAASKESANSKTDIFFRENTRRAANMLARHLRWWKDSQNNLVSWTSSLLFALVQMFYLHASKHEESFDEIQLLIVDTASFPKRVFMRDLDLIRAFISQSWLLRHVKSLRSRQSSKFSGYYYFGEYLSQGALRIEGHCMTVSARRIIDQGLYNIRPEFKEFANWERGSGVVRWANAVIEMRELFYRDEAQPQIISKKGLSAAFRIASQFGPDFQVPMLANLVALAAPRHRDVYRIPKYRRFVTYTDYDRKRFLEELAMIEACPRLPEVQMYAAVMQSIYDY